MRTCVLRTVMRWLGPTAPWVSGGIAVVSSAKARKLLAGAGESGAGPASACAAALESREGDTPSAGSRGPGTGDSPLRLTGMRRLRGDARQDGDEESIEDRHWDHLREQRLPALVQLLVESGEHHRGEGVVCHERGDIDDRCLTEDSHHLRVGFGADFSVAKELAAEGDDRSLLFRGSRDGPAEFHGVEDLGIQALLQGDRLVRRPLELAVELARGHQDRKLPQARLERHLVAQDAVHLAERLSYPRAVQPDAAGPLKTRERGTLGIENRVVDALSLLVERLALRQRQPGA